MSEIASAAPAPGMTRAAHGGGARLGAGLLLLPALLLLVPAYAFPVGGLLLTSFGTAGAWTTANYVQVLTDRTLWAVLGETLLLAAQVTLCCAVLGYPVAYLMLRAPARWQKIILALIALPVWTSVLVRAYAWIVLLGRTGIVNHLLMDAGLTSQPLQILYGRFAVVLGLVHVMLPYAVFPLLGVMKRIDERLVAAAESLGAPRWASFLLVFLPLSLPGIASGAALIFILSIGFFVTPALLGGLQETTYVMLIEQQVDMLVNWPMAAAMSVVLLLVTLAVVLVFGRNLGLVGNAGEGRAAFGRGFPRVMRAAAALLALVLRRQAAAVIPEGRRPRRRRPIALPTVVVAWAVIAFVVVPIAIFFPLSFSGSPFLEFPPKSLSLRWYANYFGRADWIQPTIISFEVAIITMVVATLLGCAAAVGVVRARFRGAGACLAFLLSPAIVPTLVTAVALYFQLARLHLIGSVPGLVLAHLVIALPLVLLVVLGALRRVDTAPERAARSLGANPFRAFMSTTFVLIRPSVLSAALFAFLASFDDVVIALFISGTTASTLPKRMWEGIRLEIDPTVAAVSSLLILLSGLLLLVVELAKRRARWSAEAAGEADPQGGR